MLSDIERKVLRVISNYSAGRRRTPTVDELCIKTGRDRGGIMTVLGVLAKEEYIEWHRSEPDKMEVYETWERKGR
ncbi:hypothetical protein FB479_11688 [Brevibacillus sp. AG162]|uniref:hypothetical protein n=1 Tax=Brevibacillus sp. AG162 TaxID=2572910 RepID=UPI0011513F97|nr:hypothetical protein [Brevibacillus sp. AG162]TQK41987.1 hypothetical protein FB479_11688 [Brevibacillus sp. AG162]